MSLYLATAAEGDLARVIGTHDRFNASDSLSVSYTREALRRLRNSVKFSVPDNGHILPAIRGSGLPMAEVIGSYIPHMQLPYVDTLIEYSFQKNYGACDDPKISKELLTVDYTGVVLLAKQTGLGEISIIPIWRARENRQETWVMSNFMALINSQNFTLDVLPITDMGITLGRNSHVAINDVRGEVSCLLEFLAALACSNTKVADEPFDREKINKKREKRGKIPFYSYKVLTLSQGGSSSSVSNGLGRSPRVHLRRGHIRRLENKTVWVNAAVVGDKSKGMVVKDYAVQRMSV